MRPIIALLTDFGTRDHYVGAMKGAILSIAPEAQLVDLVHDLEAHDIEGGAYALAAAYRAFPPGTVFVAVVDPGVGSARRGIAVEAGGYRFVAPDNGVLSAVLDDHPPARVHVLLNPRLWREAVSRTFHGRDVFGPVAAHLAMGVVLDDVGPPIADPHRLPADPPRAVGPDEIAGRVVHVDRFGNLITNLPASVLEAAAAGGDPAEWVAVIGGTIVPAALAYADVGAGDPCALVGSSGRLELAVNGGRADEAFRAGRGAPVSVRRVRMRP
jgi:S-adenosylmethionine hydrolase